MNLQKNILLKDHTTFKIGGPAKYFVQVTTVAEAQEAFQWARQNKQPILLLGGGSNLVISDQGWDGLVVRLSLNNVEFDDTTVRVGAGVALAELIESAFAEGLVGLEFASGIPGTIGGAVRGNAGTYGVDMSSVIVSITYLNEDLQLRTIDKDAAQFDYRHSIFKTIKAIILQVELRLRRGEVAASKKLVQERLEYRRSSHPTEASAGCIFKNVRFDQVDLDKLVAKGLDLTKFEKFRKIPSGYLIERLGLKGKQIGGIQISKKHANYMINTGNGTAEQVIMMISFIKQQVRDAYGIQLEEEVQLVGLG